ncbi:MAG: cytochrome c-type biogenesis protein CcmH [Anaerolineae bacterium]
MVLTLIIVASFAFAGGVLAQEPTADQVNDIAKKLNCPTCAGINLADCRTQTCEQWRGQIRDKLAEGKSEQQILDDFVTLYGDHVLQNPPKRGVALWVWIIPVIGLLAGGVWLVYFLQGSSRAQPVAAGGDGAASTPAEPVPPDEVADEYLARVERDLKKF